MTEMRPDPDSDLAGEESEYGDDTGFAAEATRVPGADHDRPDADRDDTEVSPSRTSTPATAPTDARRRLLSAAVT